MVYEFFYATDTQPLMTKFLPPWEHSSLPSLQKAYADLVPIAAYSDEPILITGPTGTGKTRLAGFVHALRCQSRNIPKDTTPFKEVNCATLVGDTLISELFGHVKGAFTGAAADRKGILECADGGTAFLDEVNELSPSAQAMLLGALHKKAFYRLGDFKTLITSNFRLVCASNRNLHQLAASGAFRGDLLARIAFHTIHLPSLKERLCDLPTHAKNALDAWNHRHASKVSFLSSAYRAFLAFATSPDAAWPGNFRDLNASIRHMCIIACAACPNRPRITPSIVACEIQRLSAAWSNISPAQPPSLTPSSPLSLDALADAIASHRHRLPFFDALEFSLQDLALARFNGNKAAAARFLYQHPARPLANASDLFAKRRARLAYP